MSEALGDSVFIEPIERDGDQWTGNIVSIGAKTSSNSTYHICDVVVYQDMDIRRTVTYDGVRVHDVFFDKLRRIEGIY
jgi:hypothetical protein